MALQTIEHQVDFCVIGGGLSGLCAAVAAARHGAKTLLMQERPMLGGNASSEIRMWVCGAHGYGNRETGIIEEIMMNNLYQNPYLVYSLWDGVLYELARNEENLTLLLNCSCMDAEMRGNTIVSARGWQMTTQTFHSVRARLYADCSGDSILAPLTGAQYRQGREARSEYGEDFEPETADKKTMGLSLGMQAREEAFESEYIPPSYAEKITKADLTHRLPNMENISENYWYLELGGEGDSILDTERVRDELLALNYGLWDYLKNAPENREKNKYWRIEHMSMLPGKRESRRYVGAYTMTAQDVASGGVFADEIAYGGWTMDDHNPAGFRTAELPTIFHPAPSPFGVPYRCLYSANIENLFFAGRNISVTHAAMSATRVMATCALLGQAAGTAAALCVKHACTPAEISRAHILELQAALAWDDCFLPHIRRALPKAMRGARLTASDGDPAPLLDGVDREREGDEHAWCGRTGASVTISLKSPTRIQGVRIVFDSELNRTIQTEDGRALQRNMLCNRPRTFTQTHVPNGMTRAFLLTAQTETGIKVLLNETNNYHRLYVFPVDETVWSVTLTIVAPWRGERARVFAFDVY